MTLEELLKQLDAIMKRAEPATRDALTKFAQQLKAYGEERDREIEAKDKEIADLKAQIEAKDKEIADLKVQLGGVDQVTRASPSDIAKSFRAVMDEFHTEAREAEDVGVAIKTLDLEVKGLVEVDEQRTTLVLPSTGAAVDSTALSTFRVSFAAVPALPAEVAPEPPPEPKKPRARPKRP